jgi:hypothetical protein
LDRRPARSCDLWVRRNARNEIGGTFQRHQSTGSHVEQRPKEARLSDLAAAAASSVLWPPLERGPRSMLCTPPSFPLVCCCDLEAQTKKQFAVGRKSASGSGLAGCYASHVCSWGFNNPTILFSGKSREQQPGSWCTSRRLGEWEIAPPGRSKQDQKWKILLTWH